MTSIGEKVVVCRCCLTANKQSVNFLEMKTEKFQHCGEPINVFRGYYKVNGLEKSQKFPYSNLPEQICEACFLQLQIAYAFQDKCRKSNEILIGELITKKCSNRTLLGAPTPNTSAISLEIPDDGRCAPPKAKKIKFVPPNGTVAPQEVEPIVEQQPAKSMDPKETAKMNKLVTDNSKQNRIKVTCSQNPIRVGSKASPLKPAISKATTQPGPSRSMGQAEQKFPATNSSIIISDDDDDMPLSKVKIAPQSGRHSLQKLSTSIKDQLKLLPRNPNTNALGQVGQKVFIANIPDKVSLPELAIDVMPELFDSTVIPKKPVETDQKAANRRKSRPIMPELFDSRVLLKEQVQTGQNVENLRKSDPTTQEKLTEAAHPNLNPSLLVKRYPGVDRERPGRSSDVGHVGQTTICRKLPVTPTESKIIAVKPTPLSKVLLKSYRKAEKSRNTAAKNSPKPSDTNKQTEEVAQSQHLIPGNVVHSMETTANIGELRTLGAIRLVPQTLLMNQTKPKNSTETTPQLKILGPRVVVGKVNLDHTGNLEQGDKKRSTFKNLDFNTATKFMCSNCCYVLDSLSETRTHVKTCARTKKSI